MKRKSRVLLIVPRHRERAGPPSPLNRGGFNGINLSKARGFNSVANNVPRGNKRERETGGRGLSSLAQVDSIVVSFFKLLEKLFHPLN